MTAVEKLFVNRPAKAQRNIERLRARLADLERGALHDALELGCGNGLVSAWLAEERGLRVEGSDFDPSQIELARKLNPNNPRLHFSVQDAARLSFADASFDLVVSQNVFHHVPDWRAAVREAGRVLRPGGYLVWYDLAFPGLVRRLLGGLLRNYGLYTYPEITGEFAHRGFQTCFEESVAHGPFGHHDLVLRKTAQ